MKESQTTEPAISAQDLIARLGEKENAGAQPAWQQAWTAGVAAVQPLIGTLADADAERARSARRALWNIVEHATAPSAKAARAGIRREIVAALGAGAASVAIARELLWMLSVAGDDDTVPVVSGFLEKAELREDARCVLQRMPGSRATAALKKALQSATGDFACALADALRARGETVRDHPSLKTVPNRATSVGKVG